MKIQNSDLVAGYGEDTFLIWINQQYEPPFTYSVVTDTKKLLKLKLIVQVKIQNSKLIAGSGEQDT